MLNVRGPAPGFGNGVNMYLMQSSEYADRIIDAFKKYYRDGLNPNMVIDDILEKYNISENDITEADIQRINKEVNRYYKYGV